MKENNTKKTLTVWYYPGCTKSISLIQKLDEFEVNLQIRDLKTKPLHTTELIEIIEKFQIPIDILFRTQILEISTQLAMCNNNEEKIELLISHPEYIQRPIIFIEDRYYIARQDAEIKFFIAENLLD